ncbi:MULTISPECIES: cupin domain-containing protein [unclassified Pedobacter]|uniref:cupin domain-containing protein n=1 Tax=unclassified Pedobacter TaxID=2628915 RepID=UPI001DC5E657|nr:MULTISPECIES: cupin domain-containing protein [unclassified Pedobacter]CAH0280838.1 Oxalate-binding protein [Pedobacter sp. Bi126]CAH0307554.1 Oxalate-binding protein [Pedobacter sp. Bi36]
MIKKLIPIATIFVAAFISVKANAQSTDTSKYIIQNDIEVAKEEPGTHNGGGKTIGFNFFSDAKNLKTAFRKRTLKSGSSIGYHLQKEDEIYYVLSGNGTMQMNGKTFAVKPGDAILTRPGSSHGIAPNAGNDLTIMIVYEKK